MKWAPGLLLLILLLTPVRANAEQLADGTNQVAAKQSAADSKQRAAESEQLAAQGFEAYKAGNYETALQFYDRALEAQPAAALYFNVARIYETKLSAPEKAIEYYRKALETPDVTEALVEKSLARIRVLTALLEQPNPPEGQAPPPQPAEPPEAQAPPAESQTQADGRETSQQSAQQTIGYVVGITGLVAVGAGLGLGGWALLERNQARDTCEGNQCTTQDGVDSMNTAHDLATASTITLAVGGALSAVGLGLVLFAPSSADQHSATTVHQLSRSATGPVGLEVAVTPTFGGAQLQLAGAFF